MMVHAYTDHPRSETMRIPLQSAPVLRDDPISSASPDRNSRGVEPAQSRCSNMKGLARQMCYASLYGVSV
jgi:hypothetical protein